MTIAVALAALFMAAGAALAEQDTANEGPAEKGPAKEYERGEPFMEQLTKGLELTDKQVEQVRQIVKTHRQAAANFRKEHAEELKAIREKLKKAGKEGDAEALKAAREEKHKLLKQRKKLHDDMTAQLKEVLSEEQFAKAKGFFAKHMQRRHDMRIMAVLRKLDLSKEQRAAVKKIWDEAKAKCKEAEDRNKAEIMKAAMEQIKKDVLNDEQRDELKLKEMMAKRGDHRGPFQRLNLTDEQREKIRRIMHEARDRIEKEVLTEDQRKQLRKCVGPRPGKPHGKRKGPEVEDE
ncbi:MAG: Spy/CpxP family protein refolding chaperone [Phycisphaerae bacterium]|nr:Spy/CpxP family protein refolding chaperone [Phycisphaerae bacterium]